MWMSRVNEWWGEFMVQIGSLFMPIAPAVLLGYGVFTTLPRDMPVSLRVVAAVAAPVGATAVEFTAGKMLVKAWSDGNKREMYVAAAVAAISVTVIGSAVIYLEAGNFQKIINIGLYIVSLATYLAQALNQLGRKRETVAEKDSINEIRLMELQVEKAKADAAAARATARAAVSTATTATPSPVTATTAVSTATAARYSNEVTRLHSQMNGDVFDRRTVEETLGVKRTKAGGIIKDGVAMGMFREVSTGRYKAVHD